MQKCFQVLKLDLKKLVFFSIYSSLFKIWYWTKNVSFRKVKCNLWRKLVKWGKKRQNSKCNFGWRNNWIWKLRLPTCSNNKIQFLQIYLGSENGPCSCLQFHFFFFFFFQFLWRRNSCHHYVHILNFRFFILDQAYTENDAKHVCDLIGLSSSKKMFKLLQWKPFKVLKNAFYFILKALFVLQIFVFLSWLFNQVEKTA